MPLELPKTGEVIRYAYLWKHEQDEDREEAVKDRPVAVAVQSTRHGLPALQVCPITTKRPAKGRPCIELPAPTLRRLGLDGAVAWIVTDEVNVFVWPGPDIRPVNKGSASSISYGFLPRSIVERMLEQLRDELGARRLRFVPRSE